MIIDILQTLKNAQEAFEKNDFDELRKIRAEVMKQDGQSAEGVMEFFDTNFDPELFK
jgi:hypothetical protein